MNRRPMKEKSMNREKQNQSLLCCWRTFDESFETPDIIGKRRTTRSVSRDLPAITNDRVEPGGWIARVTLRSSRVYTVGLAVSEGSY